MAGTGPETTGPAGSPSGITGTGGMFQQIHGVNEQQDFSNGLKTMTAMDAASLLIPFSRMRGEILPPSQVFVGGNVRKSSVTISRSISSTSVLPANKVHRCRVYRSSIFIVFREQLIRSGTDYNEVHYGKEEQPEDRGG